MMIVGILPTLGESTCDARALSANLRYALLNEQIFAARGEDLHISIDGTRAAERYADSIAPEAACTSVQLHQLVHPEDFAAHWNAAQAVAGIQLAVGANSPFFFGKELWRETRIALFEQATERGRRSSRRRACARACGSASAGSPRSSTSSRRTSATSRAAAAVRGGGPGEVLERGDTPQLGELKLHNGTVYRWNRPVYEVVRGRPHVRVENRVLRRARR